MHCVARADAEGQGGVVDYVPEELITSEVMTPSRAVFVVFPQLCSCQLQAPNKNVNENLTISEEGEILIIKPEHLRLLYNTDNTVVAGMNFSLETQMWNKWNFFSVTEFYFYFKPHLAASDNNLITGGQRSSSGLCLVRECVRCQDKEKQEMSGPQISGPARIQRRSLSILGFGFQSCGLGADKPGLKPPIMVSARLASQMPVASLLRCGRSLFQVALLPVHVQNSTSKIVRKANYPPPYFCTRN